MASVSGGSIEDVLSAVNSAEFEDIVGPLDNDLLQNSQKAAPVLHGIHPDGLLADEQGSGAGACSANASLLKNQLVLNKVGAIADVHTSQAVSNSVSVSPITVLHLGGHIAASPGPPAAAASVGLCGNPSLLANTLSNPGSVAAGGVDVQNILKTNVLTNGPTLVSLNPEPATLVVTGSSSSAQAHPAVNHAVNGGLQLGATNAMYNLAKIAAEQQPLVIAPQSTASNGGAAVAAGAASAMPAARTLGSLPSGAGVPQKQPQHQYILSTDIKLEKPEDKMIGQPAVSVPMSPQTITVVRNMNPVSMGQTVTQQLQIITAANQGKALLQQGPVRIQVPTMQQMHMLAPRPGTGAVTLPPGFNLPPGAMLMKNEQGQLVLMQGVQRLAPQPSAHQSAQQQQQSQQQQQQMISALRPGIMPGHPQLVQATAASGQQVLLRPGTVVQATAQQMQQHILSQPIRIQVPPQTAAAQVVSQLHQPAAGVGKSHQPAAQRSPADVENVQKCKNFLSTLIKLATAQAPTAIQNVRNLIQGLVEGQVVPEDFTAQLQQELKSSPQPGLVAFLKKSLPLLRDALRRGELHIEGVPLPAGLVGAATPVSGNSPALLPATVLQMAPGARMMLDPATIRAPVQMQPQAAAAAAAATAATAALRRQQPVLVGQQPPRAAAPRSNSTLVPTTVMQQQQPSVQLQQREPTPSPKKQKLGLQEDDDINDVAAMGGVNLTEESKNILATTNADAIGSQHRSCKDEYFLITSALTARVHAAATKKGLRDVAADVIGIISHATQEKLRHIAEKLSLLSEHRLELPKMDPRCEPSGPDVRMQLRFLEDLDKLERKRHEDEERERLLRAAKSRSKHEDPEQARLKAKAKELQEAEMEEMRKRDANITALAAIGPRKKRRPDDSPGGSGGGAPGASGLSGATSSGITSSSTSTTGGMVPLRQRTKRVNLRDLIFVMEQDRELSKSLVLYKSYLK